VLPDLLKILKEHNCCVLQAPPGAGKTTRVPLALLSNPTVLPHGVSPTMRILILEPRILATKAAAARMAESLGEPIGRTVGYRVRHDTQAPAPARPSPAPAGRR
jgi:ATP-dependent helicase HrpB